MLRTRIIPTLLLKGNGLYKGVNFKDYNYIGDPINTVKLFNDKEVDEIFLLDIDATNNGTLINFDLIEKIANEAFMPFAYGGGVKKIQDVEKLFKFGVEKIIFNTSAFENPCLLKELSSIYGNQSLVVSMDVKRNWLNRYSVYTKSDTKKISGEPLKLALKMQELGVREILINSIDQDGTMSGFDYEIISKLSNSLDIPLIACGAAGNITDFLSARQAGASAIAVGSLFVYHGPHKAVLISYPEYDTLCDLFEQNLK